MLCSREILLVRLALPQSRIPFDHNFPRSKPQPRKSWRTSLHEFGTAVKKKFIELRLGQPLTTSLGSWP
jgi:hypothetical protein